MNLKELYAKIDGDYDKAMQILSIEKLMDKHIKKFPSNPLFEQLFDAANSMDANALFESAHAIKGVCANLGLFKLSAMASEITEEFRPGNERKMTDEEVLKKIDDIKALYNKTVSGINEYASQA
ncbi:MAG: Hpt domain-containing protein [Ruminococcaceae bacterium]|nr:Hpt domain-containing protein [Oscillospiraceae bacterium]